MEEVLGRSSCPSGDPTACPVYSVQGRQRLSIHRYPPWVSAYGFVSADVLEFKPVYPFKFLYDIYVSAHKSERAHPR